MVLLYSFLPVAILSAVLVWIGSLRGEKAPGSAFRYSIVGVVAASIAYWPFSPYASEVAKEQRMERHWDEERRSWGETGSIETFAVQPDRKILVGGLGRLARLMPDGAIDPGFHCKLSQRFTQAGDGLRRIPCWLTGESW
jgi:hypothetical protein